MAKIIFVGDVHADSQNSSRIDDYPLAILNKLEEIFMISTKLNVDAIVFTGDLFNRIEVSPKYRNLVIKIFSKYFQDFDILICVGNHDIAHNIQNLKKSNLGALIYSKLISYEKINTKYDIAFLHFTHDLDDKIKDGLLEKIDNKIIVAHASISTTPIIGNYVLCDKIIKNPKTELIVSGHIHKRMSYQFEDGSYFINPGNIGRNTFDEYLENYVVKILLYDTETKNRKYIPLKSAKPFDVIFDIKLKNDLKKKQLLLDQFFSDIDTLNNNNMFTYDAQTDLKNYCLKNKIDKEVTKLILETYGASIKK